MVNIDQKTFMICFQHHSTQQKKETQWNNTHQRHTTILEIKQTSWMNNVKWTWKSQIGIRKEDIVKKKNTSLFHAKSNTKPNTIETIRKTKALIFIIALWAQRYKAHGFPKLSKKLYVSKFQQCIRHKALTPIQKDLAINTRTTSRIERDWKYHES